MAETQHEVDAPGHAGAIAHHTTVDHGDDHGDDYGHDDHAHAEDVLGPIDRPAWGAAILGVLLGLAVAAAFVLASIGVPQPGA